MLVLCSAGSFLHSRMQAISYCTYPTSQCRFPVIMSIRGLVSYREIPKFRTPYLVEVKMTLLSCFVPDKTIKFPFSEIHACIQAEPPLSFFTLAYRRLVECALDRAFW